MKRPSSRALLGLLTVLVAGTAVPVALTAEARQPAACAAPAAGGEWRSYNHDLANTRNQPAEHTITPANVASLTPGWTFVNERGGSIDATPTVADGCVFVGSSSGDVAAVNADTGLLVWTTKFPDPVQSSPTVHDGRVFVSVSKGGAPYLAALSESDGSVLWKTRMDHTPGSDTFSSPVVFDGMVMAGVSGAGAEAGTTLCPEPFASMFGCGGGGQSRMIFRGSYSIVDERTGRVLHRDHVIDDRDFKRGFAGGGVWSTAAVDPKTRYAYLGTGNPFSPREHPHTNAIVKVDLDRDRPTFGQVVGAFHGTTDLYVDGGTSKPLCQVYIDVFTCDPPDFDFGASPQLFRRHGVTYVGDMQKSGVYSAGNAGTMKRTWHATVGGPFGQFGGEATASYDGHRIVTGGSAPGLVTALTPATGATQWVAPIADGIHFQSMSTAGGVTYTTDTRGFLDAWDSATGALLMARSLGQDTGQSTYQEFSGGESVAIARHTVYVPAGPYVVAYRLP